MRPWLYSCIALVIGVSTGYGITWFEFRGIKEVFQPTSRTKAGQPPDSTTPTGPLAVVVGGPKFDFGTLNHGQTREKTFVIQNAGNEPLEITWTGQSCGMCIENKHDFNTTTVKPGDQCELTVTYSTKKLSTNFHESAKLTTNDPRNSALDLEIVGFVTTALKMDPESLSLSSISASEATSVGVKLFGFQSDNLKLVDYQLNERSAKGLIEVTAKPLDASALKAEEHARAGLELQVQVKPGLPIGPLTQSIKLTVQTDAEHLIELPVTGTIVGDLSIYGKGYDSNSGMLSLGVINRKVGLKAQFFVLVKGPSRSDVKLSVGELDPADVMQVTIGESSTVADGRAIKIPVNVSFPPGVPAMSRLGNLQGKVARIVLATNHPSSKDLTVPVRFAIE